MSVSGPLAMYRGSLTFDGGGAGFGSGPKPNSNFVSARISPRPRANACAER